MNNKQLKKYTSLLRCLFTCSKHLKEAHTSRAV